MCISPFDGENQLLAVFVGGSIACNALRTNADNLDSMADNVVFGISIRFKSQHQFRQKDDSLPACRHLLCMAGIVLLLGGRTGCSRQGS